jgi:hypothetical protein
VIVAAVVVVVEPAVVVTAAVVVAGVDEVVEPEHPVISKASIKEILAASNQIFFIARTLL